MQEIHQVEDSQPFSLFLVITLTCIQLVGLWHIPGYLITPYGSYLRRVLPGTLSAGGTGTRNS
ncbi:hypothetical protein TUM1881_18350 [Escherichia coli]|nr:hypothetical protein EsCd1KSP079_01045 [Escherichia sp. KS167_9B]BDO49261.1 hypothetical protein TUM1881_18350 [Escherichia coli]BEC00167.1 hypothetical protein VEE23_16780 [Escherichia coli]